MVQLKRIEPVAVFDLLDADSRPFTLRYGFGRWQNIQEREATERGLGMHGVRFAAEELAAVQEINFTRRYRDGWEGRDCRIAF